MVAAGHRDAEQLDGVDSGWVDGGTEPVAGPGGGPDERGGQGDAGGWTNGPGGRTETGGTGVARERRRRGWRPQHPARVAGARQVSRCG